eukprot:555556_1
MRKPVYLACITLFGIIACNSITYSITRDTNKIIDLKPVETDMKFQFVLTMSSVRHGTEGVFGLYTGDYPDPNYIEINTMYNPSGTVKLDVNIQNEVAHMSCGMPSIGTPSTYIIHIANNVASFTKDGTICEAPHTFCNDIRVFGTKLNLLGWVPGSEGFWDGTVTNFEMIASASTVPSAVLAYEFCDSAPLSEYNQYISGGTKYTLQKGLSSAKTKNDKLILEGDSFVYTMENLQFNLKSHSLEAYVKPINLWASGGGVAGIDSRFTDNTPESGHCTIQNTVFESIVYNEMNDGQWFAGSDYFRRTKTRIANVAAVQRNDLWIHIIISFDVVANTITIYTNGKQYGDVYSPSGPMLGSGSKPIGPSGNWRYLIGARTFINNPGRAGNQFQGEIDFSRLYDVPLNAAQVSVLYDRAKATTLPTATTVTHKYYDIPNDGGFISFEISHSILMIIGGMFGLVLVSSIYIMCYVNYCNKTQNGHHKYSKVTYVDNDSETV